MTKIEQPSLTDPATNPGLQVPTIDLLGMRISRVDRTQTHALLRHFLADGASHLVVTADASALAIAAADSEYREIVNSSPLVTPDGAGILWAARHLGTPLPERVSGVDLAEHLCARSGPEGYDVFFYGAAPGVAEAAAVELRRRYPEARIVGTEHGFIGPDAEAKLLERLRTLRPQVILVAMGIPRQEKWLKRHLSEIGAAIGMGVGGSFDVFSGQVTRAPVWMQKRGLEWLYRLAQNPKKLSKVATLPGFVLRVLGRRRIE